MHSCLHANLGPRKIHTLSTGCKQNREPAKGDCFAGRTRPIWAIALKIDSIAGGSAVKIGASHKRCRQSSNDYVVVISIYLLIQYRIRSAAEQPRCTNSRYTGPRQRGAASVSPWRCGRIDASHARIAGGILGQRAGASVLAWNILDGSRASLVI
eukprot:6213942-Pleurochrysis_carterae.AAC.3